MAEQRPIWRGQLRLALVSCPVAMFSASHEHGNLHFNLINPVTGNRVSMITEDADTGVQLARSDLVKGYEYEKGKYLILSDEDFDSVRIESSSTMKIDKFVEAASIDPIYFDACYYLASDGKEGKDVYLVLREAIEKTGKVALSSVVIARRERIVALRPMGKGLVVHTLHEARDLNAPGTVFADVPKGNADPEMVALAEQLIKRQTGRFDPADFEDRYETRLRKLIDAKLKGKGIDPDEEDDSDSGNVINLMDALRRSLGPDTGKAPDKGSAKDPPRRSAPQRRRS